jgi:hypothetical protein
MGGNGRVRPRCRLALARAAELAAHLRRRGICVDRTRRRRYFCGAMGQSCEVYFHVSSWGWRAVRGQLDRENQRIRLILQAAAADSERLFRAIARFGSFWVQGFHLTLLVSF